MKTKTKFMLVLTVISILSFYSCKKYPDGPAISLRSKTSRMAQNWKITSYKVNGKDALAEVSDQSSYYSSSCNTTYSYTTIILFTNMTMDLTTGGSSILSFSLKETSINQTATDNTCSLQMTTVTKTDSFSGIWKFSDDKKQVIITITGTGSTSDTYDILELRENEMKWKGTNNGDTEEFTFTK